jgi:colicin import membrane protein
VQRTERSEPRSKVSFVLSITMHVLFIAVLFFAISWKTRPPAPVVAELWQPPPPAAAPRPVPKPLPKPAPAPKPVPPPQPKVEEKPPEKVDIALEQEKERKRLEAERKRLEAIEQQRREDERKRVEAEQQRKQEEARRQAEAEKQRKEEAARKLAEAEKQRKEAAARVEAEKRFKQDLEKETRERMTRELAKASPQGTRREGVPVAVPGDPNATAGYVDKIRAKIKGNVILPAALAGNPEAEFLVQQLPTGEILSVKLTRSSGSKALDDAWERAILKSSPLPQPEQREVFQATLHLKFRPRDDQ